ncbi:hypothetical protein TEHN7118_0351 [Tetragenococcus halophilus subsp. halophilus]|uniref:Type I restriction modification DNA specificity domain-containing protein n=1 Tax=Tetragenococcus halophilus subsp. halophilus TaxID=1513897 RepID=A0A2H6CRC8_TETHA|nr:restriction endonuclease subunit S [Tetragenococcus halophilus]GBD67545.1 hypothetical protein TEHN7118_0351 [Tetragenococcus halophilus subsp. halophilus]
MWKQRKLGELGSTFTGLTGKTKEDFGHGDAKFVTYMNVFQNAVASLEQLDSVEIDPKQNEVKKGDVFFTTSSETPEEVGMSSVWKYNYDNVYLNSFTFGYRPNIEFDLDYLAAMLRSTTVRKKITFLAQGISRYNISKTKMMDIEVPVPSLEEQAKIGAFLSNVEQTITLHQEKLSKLQSLKKAALQFLFPKKDEIEPKARFTNFNDIWKQRKLGDVTPLRGGSAFQSSQFKKTGIPIVRISNILSDGFVGGTYAYYQEQKSDEGYVLYDGAIILAMSGATTGKVALLKDRTNKKFYQNQRVGYFTDLGIVDYSFISIVVQSFLFNVQLKTVLVAGAQPNISSKEINDFKFYFPINKKEQAKIGAFFKKLETIILLYQTKLDKLQMLKSALLQKMFI